MPIFKQKKQIVTLVDPETKQPIDIEEKAFLLILQDMDPDDADSGRWVKIRGRSSIIYYLSSEVFNIDPIHSFIFTGKIPLGSEVSVYSFLRHYCVKYPEMSKSINMDEVEAHILAEYPDIDLNLLFNQEMNKGLQ